MIYEIRTYDLKPHSQPEVEARFGEAYQKRKGLSAPAAFWHTDIGPLDQLVHVWPYQDLAERDRIRLEAEKTKVWPPDIGEFVVRMRSDIVIPFPYSPELKPGKMGPCFEMCTYTYVSGHLPAIMRLWEAALPARLKLGPLCGIWYSELGGQLYNFTHIWPYRTLDERKEILDEARASGVWPPSSKATDGAGYTLLTQENKILLPAAFSPLQ
jgi:hypothetical protein